MPRHSVCRIWVHVTWGTRNRRSYLNEAASPRLRKLLIEHANELGLRLRTLFVNPDHVHLLIQLPADRSLAEIVKRLKGRSSRQLSSSGLVKEGFGWAVGYGAFSVSKSNIEKVAAYINNQHEHHRTKSWPEVVQELVEELGLVVE